LIDITSAELVNVNLM